MKGLASIAFFLAASMLIPAGAEACAGCRNPNMPVNRVNSIHLREGELRAGVSLGAAGISVSHPAGCADLAGCQEEPAQPAFMHDQDIFPGEARIIAELGLSASMGVEAQLPFRYVRTTIEYTTPDGKPYEPLDPEVHHRDESLFGIGDPWVLVRWAGDLGGTTISARAGASVPVGRTETNPFILGSQGKRHQHIQFGTGTVDPILALDLSKAFGRWLVSGYGQGQASLYENSHGYRSGLRISAGAQTGRKLWRALTGSLGLEGVYEGPERWEGRIQQDGNLGRSEVLTALSLVHAFPKTTLGMSARVPVYRHIVAGDEPAGKFSSPLMVGIFAGRTFSVY
jgi:hypothetical protein